MSQHQRLLEQLDRAERSVQALPAGVRESHPVWREMQERKKAENPSQADRPQHQRGEPQR